MKALFSSLAFVAVLSTVALTACGGGGGGSTSSVPVPAQTVAPSNGSVPISSLDLSHPASSTAVNLTSTTPAGPTVDVSDAATVAVGPATAVGMPSFTDTAQHAFKGSLAARSSSASAHRTAQDVAVNSPYDLTYFGGPVMGSAVSHNLFLNCVAACRDGEGFSPGPFLSNLNNDQFITLINQYRTSPGVTLGSPIGSYTKGVGADLTATYAASRPNSTNPYFGQLSIWLQVLNAAGAPGHPTALGGGGLAHIYHVYLPKNVDTCFESPPGTPTSTCYSPDNGSTFAFCAYHGAFTATSGNARQTYVYTVEPYQDVGGCRNNVGNRSLPNALNGADPADPGYSTLSHELFETITDPLLNAWFNGLTGNEIADLCASFDNFVTVNQHPYVLQSEYSDVNHLCVSANLTGSDTTQLSTGRSSR